MEGTISSVPGWTNSYTGSTSCPTTWYVKISELKPTAAVPSRMTHASSWLTAATAGTSYRPPWVQTVSGWDHAPPSDRDTSPWYDRVAGSGAFQRTQTLPSPATDTLGESSEMPFGGLTVDAGPHAVPFQRAT